VEVPPGEVTVISTVPAASAGVQRESEVSLLTTKLAATPPTATLVAPRKPIPTTLTNVPPVVGPLSSSMAVTVGVAALETV